MAPQQANHHFHPNNALQLREWVGLEPLQNNYHQESLTEPPTWAELQRSHPPMTSWVVADEALIGKMDATATTDAQAFK
jgi:hypothetical protein